MRSTLLWALAAANVLLLAMFVHRLVGDNFAYGQAQAPVRRASDYLMIPGQLSGAANPGVVYIIDQGSGQLAACAYDERLGLEIMPPMDLNITNATGSSPTGGTRTTPQRNRR